MKKYLILASAAIVAAILVRKFWSIIRTPSALDPSIPNPCLGVIKTYKVSGVTTTYNYELPAGQGKIISVTSPNMTITYDYQTQGHIIETTSIPGNPLKVVDYTLGNNGYPESSSEERRYTYDASGRLKTIEDHGGINTFSYDAFGALVGWVRSGGASPAHWAILPTTLCMAYRPMGILLGKWSLYWPAKQEGSFDNNDPWSTINFVYTTDNLGFVKARTVSQAGQGTYTETFTYY